MARRQTEDGDMLRDGERRRVPMLMRDHATVTTGIVAGDGTGGYADRTAPSLHRPGYRLFDRGAQFAERSREAKARSYQQYDADASNAWRNSETPTGAGERGSRGQQEGDLCTLNGQPGHLRNVNGKLTCVADPDEDDDAENGNANDPDRATSDHQVRMADHYARFDAEVGNAWRKP